MSSEIREAATSTASGRAAILAAFMRFPVPLALVDATGDIVMVNPGFSARFGVASVVPECLEAAIHGTEQACRIAMRSPASGGDVEVAARVIRLPGYALLVFDGSETEEADGELRELRDRVSELERLAATDHLTGAWNRAHFDRVINAELARGAAGRQPVSLVLLDIDHFKAINDTHGHSIGDRVLRDLARLVQSRVRASDVLFRWGGEEFVVLVASAGYRGAQRVAENLRAAVAEHSFDNVGAVTISLGVAEHFGNESPEDWFGRLDEALYAAKEGGRNRVVVDRRGDSDARMAGPGVAALHLEWQEAYESGNATIDDEHRELFVLANRLIDVASADGADPAALRAALDALLAHASAHFADEEAILSSLHYADLEQHKRAHEGLLRRAAYLKAQLETGTAGLGTVVEFLAQDLVARHLVAVDRAFFPLFAKEPVQSGIVAPG